LTDESLAIAQAHHLTYIILPSWDPFMDEYARLGSRASDHSLIALLHQWLPPRWLRPVPYHLPKIAGFERLSVVIFQVTDVQDNPTALGQLAEYFLEMDQPDQAVQVSQALARLFPNELAAWVARTLVDQAQGNAAGFTEGINQLTSFIARGEEEALPWNRRVGLAIALAEGKRFDLAKEQTKQCLTLMDEAGVRSLTTLSLYRLQVLAKAFELEIADSNLRKLCRDLLPAEMREKL
jgi:tetratricopeptide (TPR) repeat protein